MTHVSARRFRTSLATKDLREIEVRLGGLVTGLDCSEGPKGVRQVSLGPPEVVAGARDPA